MKVRTHRCGELTKAAVGQAVPDRPVQCGPVGPGLTPGDELGHAVRSAIHSPRLCRYRACVPTSLVELRILEGPNLYFPRAAVKLTLDRLTTLPLTDFCPKWMCACCTVPTRSL